MTKKQKYLNSEAHGYLLESDACALLIKELERACTKFQRRIDKENAARQADFDAAMEYHSENEIQDAYGWELITEAQYRAYMDLFHRGRQALEEHAPPAVQNVLMTCAAFVGVVLALFLFTFLPTFLTGLVMKVVPLGRWPRVILEGALKMAIFLGYMFLCTRFKDLHRVFEYHGAEHKTIACYEAGLPLTVENIRKQSRFHPRCGTSFMILVIIISIFLYAVLPWTSTGMRIVYKLCMFPLLVGISYEILKWAGRSDSVLSKIVSQPGLWMQRLTTFEPDDSMIEVAIAAVTPVLPEKQEEARW